VNNLDPKDYALILALEVNPLATISELAKKLNISRPTIRSRLAILKEKGIIKKKVAFVNPEKLGLERINVIVEVENFHNLQYVEKLCWEHPYTQYRARLYGKVFGVFLVFDIPPQTQHLLVDLFTELKKRKKILNFKLFSSKVRINANIDFRRFDVKSSSWKFDWEKWFETIPEQNVIYPSFFAINNNLQCFKKTYLEILRELTKDASIKQSMLKEKLGLSKSEISRQYNYVLNNFVHSVRILYDRRKFQLTETYLAVVQGIDRKKQAQLFSKIQHDPPPFNISLDLVEPTGLIFWSHMSPGQASSFAYSLWKLIENAEVFVLDTRSKGSSAQYWFYPENFDFDAMKWKDSREYFITNVLQRLDTKS